MWRQRILERKRATQLQLHIELSRDNSVNKAKTIIDGVTVSFMFVCVCVCVCVCVLVRRGDDVGAITAAALHPLYKAAVHFILTPQLYFSCTECDGTHD